VCRQNGAAMNREGKEKRREQRAKQRGEEEKEKRRRRRRSQELEKDQVMCVTRALASNTGLVAALAMDTHRTETEVEKKGDSYARPSICISLCCFLAESVSVVQDPVPSLSLPLPLLLLARHRWQKCFGRVHTFPVCRYVLEVEILPRNKRRSSDWDAQETERWMAADPIQSRRAARRSPRG
jgi:hypothetical protein